MQETWVWSLGVKISWRRKWKPTPVFLLGKSHRQNTCFTEGPHICSALPHYNDKKSEGWPTVPQSPSLFWLSLLWLGGETAHVRETWGRSLTSPPLRSWALLFILSAKTTGVQRRTFIIHADPIKTDEPKFGRTMWGMWDPSSLTRDRTCAPAMEALEVLSLNHWTTREVLKNFLFSKNPSITKLSSREQHI